LSDNKNGDPGRVPEPPRDELRAAKPHSAHTSSAKSFTVPKGFRFGAVAAGVKQAGAARRDVALIVSDADCAAAGVFTVNRMRAAPCDFGAGRLPAKDIRTIVANGRNANAMVGMRGVADERAVA